MEFKSVSLGEKKFEDKPIEYVDYAALKPNTVIAEGIYTGSFTGGKFNTTTLQVSYANLLKLLI